MGANGSCECFSGGASSDRPKSSLNARIELEKKTPQDAGKQQKYQPLGNEKATPGTSAGKSSNPQTTSTRPKSKSKEPKKLELSDFIMLRVRKLVPITLICIANKGYWTWVVRQSISCAKEG